MRVLQMALRESRVSDNSAMDYPGKRYVDGMKFNSPTLTAKWTVELFFSDWLVGVSRLLANKKRKKKKMQG